MSFNNWEVYCIPEDTWVLTQSITRPTTCPNNVAHSIRNVRPIPLPSFQKVERNNGTIVDNTFDIGIYGEYVDNGVTKYTGIFCDADDDKIFKMYHNSEEVPIATINTNATGFTLGDLQIGQCITTGITSSGDIYLSGDLNINGSTSVIDHINDTANPHNIDIDNITPSTTKGDLLVENGSNVIRLGVGSDGEVLTADSAEASGIKWTTTGGEQSDIHVAIIKDEKSQGTNGGTFTSGAWRTRDLNTLEQTGTFCSLSSNEFTLTSGKYYFESLAPAYSVSGHQSRLYNVTDTSVNAMGSNTHEASSSGSNSIIKTVLDISSSKTYRIEHRCESTDSGDGFGQAMGWGTEIYTIVTITKIG